jgi:assimilatory nitrate reductase electron transfer subunit
VVDDDLASPDDPHVHAIGDCAQPPSGATGLVAQGWQQAARLVARLTDRPSGAPGEATHDVVRVKASGMSMVSMGVCGDFDRDDPRYRVLSAQGPGERALRRGRRSASGHLVGRDLHRRRRRRRHALGPLHPLAARARRPGTPARPSAGGRHGNPP